MPALTVLTRDHDICWSQWRSPRQYTKIELRQVDMPADGSPFAFSLDGSTISLREVMPTLKTKGGRFFLEVSLHQRTIQIPRIMDLGPGDDEGEIVFDDLTLESAIITVTGSAGFISEQESQEIYQLIPERLYGENGQLIAPYMASKGYEDHNVEREVSPFLLTPITPEQITEWLNGADPPRPTEVPSDWMYQEGRLERMYTNGSQTIGDNEIGDIGGYDSKGARVSSSMRAVIVEPGDKAVVIDLNTKEMIVNKDGSISTKNPKETLNTNNQAKIHTYRIVDGVAEKMSER